VYQLHVHDAVLQRSRNDKKMINLGLKPFVPSHRSKMTMNNNNVHVVRIYDQIRWLAYVDHSQDQDQFVEVR
jgi:hypothetical protein